MAKPQLVHALEHLGSEELKKFQWLLMEDVVDGFDTIPRSELEHADLLDTVDKMVAIHSLDGAFKVLQANLRKMKRNDLVEKEQLETGKQYMCNR